MSFRASVLVILLFVSSACSATPAPLPAPTRAVTPRPSPTDEIEGTPTPFVTRAPGTVLFSVFGDAVEKKAYDALVAAFKTKNPDVSVETEYIPNQFAYRDRLEENFAIGSPPDVVLLNNRRYGFYGLRRLLEPLGPYLEKSAVVHEAEFFPEALAPFRINGQLTCIPQNASNLVVYFNKDLFNQANVPYPRDGWTWDDFLAAAKALTRDTNGDGKIDQYGLGTEGDLLRLAPFVWQNGGQIFDDEVNPTKLTLDSPASIEALHWVIDLQVKHHVVPDPQAEVIESFETRFINGSIAMFINQRRGVGMYRDNMKMDWDVAPLPRHKQAAGVLQADAYCIPIASANKQNAWKLIEFASSAEGQTILASSGRVMPSLRAVAESDAFLQPGQKPEHARIFIDTLPQTHAFPIVLNWAQIEEIAGEQIERAFHGTLALETILPRASERIETLLKKR